MTCEEKIEGSRGSEGISKKERFEENRGSHSPRLPKHEPEPRARLFRRRLVGDGHRIRKGHVEDLRVVVVSEWAKIAE